MKSLGGERLERVDVDARGLVGDRGWALVRGVDGKIASGKPTRRFAKVPGLLHHSARLVDGEPEITLADGRSAPASAAGELTAAIAPAGWALEREDGVSFFDTAAVHLVTDTTLATLDISVERLRPNLLIAGAPDDEPFPEDAWIGRTVRVGGVVLRIFDRTERCVMVNHSRPTLPHVPRLLQKIGRANAACAGVYASVMAPGSVGVGDAVVVEHPH